MTAETLSDNLKVIEYSGFTLDVSKITLTNLNSSYTLYTENNAVYVMAKRTITFSIKESGYGTFKNSSGSTVSSVTVPHGSAVTISGSKLTVNGNTYTATATAATAQYSYAFSKFSIANNSAITANTTITVTFTRTTRSYTITFANSASGYGTVKDSSGNTKTSVTATYGTAVSTNGSKITIGSTTYTATPTTQTAQYSYSFSSWSGVPTSVSGAVTITASYTRATRKYQVSFAVNDASYGSTSSKYFANVEYGSAITVSDNTIRISGMTVVAAAADQTAQYTYAFSSWSNVPSTNTVTGAVTITANFTRSTRYYTVSYTVSPSGYGSVTRTSQSVPYGASVSLNTSTNVLTVNGSTNTPTVTNATGYTTTFNGLVCWNNKDNKQYNNNWHNNNNCEV